MKFSTKARTLLSLEGIIKNASIPTSLYFNYEDWINNRAIILGKIRKKFKNNLLIIRSSSAQEDQAGNSNAGVFLSVLNVKIGEIENQIEKVFDSYTKRSKRDEVLIQPMLNQVLRSGVAFSHDPNLSSPYRKICWAENSDTTHVTSGKAFTRIWSQAPTQNTNCPNEISSVLSLIDELLEIFDNCPIDIEFAYEKIGNHEKLWLLQVRPLNTLDTPEKSDKLIGWLIDIENQIQERMKPHPFLVGDTTCFGVMPDWNPAEILGLRPRPLALSLYKELITDNIWAYQRHNYGYRNLRSFPLLVDFFSLPYIDVRVSFNSFIPGDIPDELANKLVNYYLEKLKKAPALHDKVEFEIVMSCLAFDIEARLNELRANGFTEQECLDLRSSLIGLTNKIINQKNGFWIDDAKKIELLSIRREKLANSSLNDKEKIYWLMEDAKRYGTLPFAGLARAAFISIQLLKSLVSIGILNQREYENFLGSTSSVFRVMIEDQIRLSTKDFLSKYGHLRPGTYDILSPRYDEKPEIYFTDRIQTEHQKHKFVVSDSQRGKIKGLISRYGLEIGVDELFDFIKKSIELREMAKFEFTKNVSALLKLLSEFGLRNELSKEDLSFVNISFFSDLTNTDKDLASLRKLIDLGKENYNKSNSILLPPLITNTQDIWGFEWPLTLPNFVTKKSVIAECTLDVLTSVITDKIVLIPNADPGFDWIFSHRIAGLVTEWGGANSHMSIRANEMGIPAIIGAGELNFQKWSTARKLYINCEAETVQIVS